MNASKQLEKGQTFDSDERMLERVGCTWSEAKAFNFGLPLKSNRGPYVKYLHQRTQAAKRGIGWEISLPEWIAIWSESGKWDLRGRGKGRYCMARHGDEGPYKVGNVSIQPVEVNSRDGIKRANFTKEHRMALLGKGRGWTLTSKGAKRYQVVVGKKYVGVFATAEEAECAYQLAAALHLRNFCSQHGLNVAGIAALHNVQITGDRT